MSRYILRRLIQMIPLMFGITLITFLLVNLLPGSPLANMAFNPTIRQEDIERIERQLGLHEPLHIRYFVWVSHLARGDFGLSLLNQRPVLDEIVSRLPNTLLLTGTALLLSLIFSIPVGVYSAVRRNSAFDNTATALSVAGFSMPTFWLGLMAILIFAVKAREWGWPIYFPAGNAYDLRGGGGFWDRMHHLFLPAATLAFVQTAAWTRYIRAQMLEVLNQDYMRTATSKGLRERIVIFRHGLRNAVLPLVTLLGIAIPDLFGGSLVIEQIFNWPGVGRLAFSSAISRDYTMVMGVVVFVSFLVILGNLIADVVYGLLDPRIRLE